jgi:hypothetical protein
MTLGSTLLLAANLMSEKASPQAETPASSEEVIAAERLIELAMRESKTLGDGKIAPGGRNAYVPRRRLEALKVNQPPV